MQVALASTGLNSFQNGFISVTKIINGATVTIGGQKLVQGQSPDLEILVRATANGSGLSVRNFADGTFSMDVKTIPAQIVMTATVRSRREAEKYIGEIQDLEIDLRNLKVELNSVTDSGLQQILQSKINMKVDEILATQRKLSGLESPVGNEISFTI